MVPASTNTEIDAWLRSPKNALNKDTKDRKPWWVVCNNSNSIRKVACGHEPASFRSEPRTIGQLSRRRRTFVQWSHSHSRFLFCPDPTTTSPSTFGDTVKKKYFEFESELPDTPYIPLEKILLKWILCISPKIDVSAPLKKVTSHDFEVLIISTTWIS